MTRRITGRMQAQAPRPHRAAGFTMVELIIVMVLIGILGAIGAARFFDRSGFDAAAYTEQTRGMLRYAQKLAIAQRRAVYVQAGAQGIALCYAAATPCSAASLVRAPSGKNSESKVTSAWCTVDGAFAPTWYCEGRPSGLTLAFSTGTAANFYFDGLGRPYFATDTGQDSSFQSGVTLTIGGDGNTRSVAVSPETGYVF
jgi:MSHA pilin protein MshC